MNDPTIALCTGLTTKIHTFGADHPGGAKGWFRDNRRKLDKHGQGLEG